MPEMHPFAKKVFDPCFRDTTADKYLEPQRYLARLMLVNVTICLQLILGNPENLAAVFCENSPQPEQLIPCTTS